MLRGRALLSGAAALLLAGCGFTPLSVKAYDGPDRAPDQLATIKLQNGIFVASIDETFVRNLRTQNPMGGGLDVSIAIPPGRHVVMVGYVYGSSINGAYAKPVRLAVNVQAQRRYFLKSVQPKSNLWTAELVDITDRTDCDRPSAPCPSQPG